MSRLSYTAKLRLSITIDEVLKYCDVKCLRKDLSHHIERELMQCAEGIISGESGGSCIEDWRYIFFLSLEKEGVVSLNEKFHQDF